MDYLSSLIQDNDFFQGGFVLMVFGAILALLKPVPGHIGRWLMRRFMMEVEVTQHDEAFRWIEAWLSTLDYSEKRARRLSIFSRRRDCDEEHDARPEVFFSPAPGTHYIWYGWRLIILERVRKDGGEQDDNRSEMRLNLTFQSFTLKFVGRNRDVAKQFVLDARDAAIPPEDKRICLWEMKSWGDYSKTSLRMERRSDSIILPEGEYNKVRDDLSWFMKSRDWYNKRGVPYRRGYMFYGLPGTGKSSLVLALASEFQRDVALVSIGEKGMTDSSLMNALTNMPAQSIVLLEDIDCVCNDREMHGDMTFSGLLNALDGLSSPEGRILFATTNHIERLDKALIRPGRFDYVLEFFEPTHEQRRRMFLKFYPGEEESALKFATTCPSDKTMADIQNYLIFHKDDAANEAALGVLNE